MRIIGGRDYYDGAMAFGQDSECVFLRKSFEQAAVVPYEDTGIAPVKYREVGLCSKQGRGHRSLTYDRWVLTEKGKILLSPVAVWFAGRRYGGVTKTEFNQSGLVSPYTFWSSSELEEFLDAAGIEIVDENRLWNRGLSKQGLSEFFYGEGSESERKWMAASRYSIAVSGWTQKPSRHPRGNDIEVPCWKFDVDGLGAMGFARRLPPYEAFQELAAWVGGVLPRPGNPTVEIASDVVKRNKHGFDKRSFKHRIE